MIIIIFINNKLLTENNLEKLKEVFRGFLYTYHLQTTVLPNRYIIIQS